MNTYKSELFFQIYNSLKRPWLRINATIFARDCFAYNLRAAIDLTEYL